MLDVVYEFFVIAGLEENPANMMELIPYLLRFLVALGLVLAVFNFVKSLSGFFVNWRWFR